MSDLVILPRHALEHPVAPDQEMKKRRPAMSENESEKTEGQYGMGKAEPAPERCIMRQDRGQ